MLHSLMTQNWKKKNRRLPINQPTPFVHAEVERKIAPIDSQISVAEVK